MSVHHLRLSNRRWAALRRAVFKRDGYRCRECGRAGRLECDHTVPLHHGGARYALDNLQTLCRNCHVEKTRRENETWHSPEREEWRRFVRGFPMV